MIKQKIQSSEQMWVWRTALFVMLVTTVPYIVAYYSQGVDWVFTGFLFGVEDGNSYIAKMMSGYQGEWLFKTPYTTSPQSGAFVFFPYILLGKLAWGDNIHLSLVIIFHLFRIIAGSITCVVTYKFITLFINFLKLRKLAWFVAILGGGLGWSVIFVWGEVFGSLPLEYYSPESFGFLGIYGIPHLAAARALLLYGLIAYLNRDGLRAGLSWLLMGLFQPVTIVIGWVVIVVHIAVLWIFQKIPKQNSEKREWVNWRAYLQTGITTIIISSPLVIYSTVIFAVDPFLRSWKWSGQNLITSPHPVHYLLAYGLLLPLMAKGIMKAIGRKDEHGLLLSLWIFILPLLVYTPVDFQRRLAEGAWVAIVILSVYYLESQKGRVSRWKYLPFALTFPSTVLLLIGGLFAAINATSPIYVHSDKISVYQYLAETAEENEVVISAFDTGNALTAWAPMRVVLGHGPESVNFNLTSVQVHDFYDEFKDDGVRLSILSQHDVRYVFWGPDERMLGSWNPGNATYLDMVYEVGEYHLYEVVN